LEFCLVNLIIFQAGFLNFQEAGLTIKSMEKIIKSQWFIVGAIVVAFFLTALLSFAVGVKVGSRKALFSARWGENYQSNFMNSRSGMDGNKGPMGMMKEGMRNFEGRDFRNPHGLAGTIIFAADNKLVIKDRDNKENTVVVKDKTIIKFGRDTIGFNDLKNDQQVVVMGNPGSDGNIGADLIRVFGANDNLNNAQNNSQPNPAANPATPDNTSANPGT
jgi:hypothetical protein